MAKPIDSLLQTITSKITLNQAEIDFFCSLWKPRFLKKGQYLVQAGDVCKYDSFVVKGCLKIFHTNWQTGQEYILSFSLEDWWASDLESFVKQRAATYDIQALEDCQLLQIDYPSFQELLKQIPQFERYFRIITENYLFSLQKRILGTISQTKEERYKAFIKQYPQINKRLPQYLIASYLGITPEFLSKIRSKKES
ncbi:hypothetical protein BKI52_40340 [marine bacterium AO1-C]|nr:hypothetical protein BKI52_40340 [marine bacterium AO1-C]